MSEEHRRKRVRKGTKSCWECKRRKVKCIWPSEDHTTCTSCLERKTPCLTQDFDEEPSSSSAGDSALASRLSKVETLLENLVEKISKSPEGGIHHLASNNGLTPESIIANELPPTHAPPFEGAGQARQRTLPSSTRPIGAIRTSGGTRNPAGSYMTGKLATIKRRLVAMLPGQADVDYMFSISYGWFLIKHHMLVYLPEGAETESGGLFDISSTSKGHPMTIAKLLLCIAICIQQLPSDVDMRRVQTLVPLHETMERITEYISSAITSDENLVSSVEGIECLSLQAIYQTNSGNLQRAWLGFRKAIDLAQLIGLHRVSLKPSNETSGSSELRRNLWSQIVRGERYLSTIIGVPSVTGPSVFPFENDSSEPSLEDMHHNRLFYISGLILARNQDKSTHSFSTTQRIDEELNHIANELPRHWWDIPSDLSATRTLEASIKFDQVCCQYWHYQLLMLLHLPFMLQATSDRRYAYSRECCLNGSRGLIKRWIVMCDSQAKLFSNLFEFQAFMAATTLLLGLFVPYSPSDESALHERYEDYILVEKVIQMFNEAEGNSTHISIGKQSISVMRTLQKILRNEHSVSPKLRLEIPFFGIIDIARSGAIQPLEGESIIGSNSHPTARLTELSSVASSAQPELFSPVNFNANNVPNSHIDQTDQWISGSEGLEYTGAGLTNTVLRFSDGHLQIPEMASNDDNLFGPNWAFDESETIVFDSLINTDLLADWNF